MKHSNVRHLWRAGIKTCIIFVVLYVASYLTVFGICSSPFVEELQSNAYTAVMGTITNILVTEETETGKNYHAELKVEKYLKNDLSHSFVYIRYFTADEMISENRPHLWFTEGERVILYLKRSSGFFYVLGDYRGKFVYTRGIYRNSWGVQVYPNESLRLSVLVAGTVGLLVVSLYSYRRGGNVALSKFSVDRETKVISAILFATLLSLIGAHYLDRQTFVDWSDVEKIAEFNREATLGDTIQIGYYLVNTKSHDIKVIPRHTFGTSTYYASKPDERVTTHVNVNWAEKYITVPAKSSQSVHTETVTATMTGTLHIQVSGLPEAEILVLPEGYNYTSWHSEPPSPWDGADLLPVETVVNDWRDRGMNVYLPQYLPDNIEPLGARIQVTDEGLASSAVFVFSAYNRSQTGTAEVTIGVQEGVSSFENHTSWGMYIYSDPVSARIELPVEVRNSEYLELYGPHSTWVQMQIDSMYYWMRAEPSILLEDIKKIILSMTCVPLASETPFNVVIELNKYVFGSQDTAKLIITNKDSHLITYGSSYNIEKQVEGEWVEVSPFPWPFAWTSECRFLPAWETRRENIKIDHLEPGHYRVSKTINHERTQTELTFTLEFDIRDEG